MPNKCKDKKCWKGYEEGKSEWWCKQQNVGNTPVLCWSDDQCINNACGNCYFDQGEAQFYQRLEGCKKPYKCHNNICWKGYEEGKSEWWCKAEDAGKSKTCTQDSDCNALACNNCYFDKGEAQFYQRLWLERTI